MTGLRASDLRSVLELTAVGLTVTDFAQVPPLLGALAAVVGSDSATLTHLDLDTGRELVALWPAARAHSTVLERYPAVGATHPLRGPLAGQRAQPLGRRRPVRITDVLSRRQWRSTAIHREVLSDVHDQMTLLLAARGPVVHAVTLARGDRPFSERQCDLLAACGPHLAAAAGRARREGRTTLQIAPVPLVVPAQEVPGSRATLATPGPGTLSDRERQVLALVAEGLTDAQVARRLGLRPATVSKHLARVYARLGLTNRAAATRYWTGHQHANTAPSRGSRADNGCSRVAPDLCRPGCSERPPDTDERRAETGRSTRDLGLCDPPTGSRFGRATPRGRTAIPRSGTARTEPEDR